MKLFIPLLVFLSLLLANNLRGELDNPNLNSVVPIRLNDSGPIRFLINVKLNKDSTELLSIVPIVSCQNGRFVSAPAIEDFDSIGNFRIVSSKRFTNKESSYTFAEIEFRFRISVKKEKGAELYRIFGIPSSEAHFIRTRIVQTAIKL